MEKKRICFVVAAPTSADGFLTEQIRLLSREYDVYLAANGEYGSEWKNVEINAFYSFPIRRNISVFNDIKALFSLIRYFRRMKMNAGIGNCGVRYQLRSICAVIAAKT